jgi:hypothetical protein
MGADVFASLPIEPEWLGEDTPDDNGCGLSAWFDDAAGACTQGRINAGRCKHRATGNKPPKE